MRRQRFAPPPCREFFETLMSETHVSSSSSTASSPASPTAASSGPSESAFRVAALQMVSTPDRERNLAEAERLIAEAAADGAQLVLLPEYFCFMGFKDTDKLAVREPYQDGQIQRFLADAARRHTVWVIGGTLPLMSP
jgi:nitrilase